MLDRDLPESSFNAGGRQIRSGIGIHDLGGATAPISHSNASPPVGEKILTIRRHNVGFQVKIGLCGCGRREVDDSELARYFATNPNARERFLVQWGRFVATCLRLDDKMKHERQHGDGER